LFTDSDHPVSLRVGKQVISWGESAFIQNGISAVQNSADVNKAVQPGVEVKEILRPLGAVFGSISLTDNLTMQAYYQYEWKHIITPAYGSYLNPLPDFLNSDGGEKLLVPTDVLAEFMYLRGNGTLNDESDLTNSHIAVERLADEDASDDGQWGVAFNLFVPEWNDTEFGFYYLNYHRKLPDLIVRNQGGKGLEKTYGGVSNPDWDAGDYFGNPFGGTYVQDCWATGPANCDATFLSIIADGIDVASLNVKYYEDVKLFGFSWNTVIPWTDTAFSGEIAFHHDIPVQTCHAFQCLLERGVIGGNPVIGSGEFVEEPLSTREDVVVTQLFFFHDFNNFTFADDVGLFMEIGWIHAVDLDDGVLNAPFVFDDGTAEAAVGGTGGAGAGDDYANGAIPGGYFDPGPSPVPSAPAGATNPGTGAPHQVTFPFYGMGSQKDRSTVYVGNSAASKDSYGYQMIWVATWYNGLPTVTR
jgi:hypothetical protein